MTFLYDVNDINESFKNWFNFWTYIKDKDAHRGITISQIMKYPDYASDVTYVWYKFDSLPFYDNNFIKFQLHSIYQEHIFD